MKQLWEKGGIQSQEKGAWDPWEEDGERITSNEERWEEMKEGNQKGNGLK